jgi:GNAT superfamily N-acetyltransferase
LFSHPRPLQENDIREGFDCGRSSMNVWFQRNGWNNHINGISRVTIITEVESGRIAAYATLSAAQIQRAFLPKPDQRNRPDPIPVTLLGQLAVDGRFQKRGLAADLLQVMLKTALAGSQIIASAGVVTHPLDGDLRAFYKKYGFADLPNDPRCSMMVPMKEVARAFA